MGVMVFSKSVLRQEVAWSRLLGVMALCVFSTELVTALLLSHVTALFRLLKVVLEHNERRVHPCHEEHRHDHPNITASSCRSRSDASLPHQPITNKQQISSWPPTCPSSLLVRVLASTSPHRVESLDDFESTVEPLGWTAYFLRTVDPSHRNSRSTLVRPQPHTLLCKLLCGKVIHPWGLLFPLDATVFRGWPPRFSVQTLSPGRRISADSTGICRDCFHGLIPSIKLGPLVGSPGIQTSA